MSTTAGIWLGLAIVAIVAAILGWVMLRAIAWWARWDVPDPASGDWTVPPERDDALADLLPALTLRERSLAGPLDAGSSAAPHAGRIRESA